MVLTKYYSIRNKLFMFCFNNFSLLPVVKKKTKYTENKKFENLFLYQFTKFMFIKSAEGQVLLQVNDKKVVEFPF